MERILFRIGEALFGSRWQCDLARAADMDERTMRRRVTSPQDLRADELSAMRRLLVARRKELERLLPAVDRQLQRLRGEA